jgi:hypothetical protein
MGRSGIRHHLKDTFEATAKLLLGISKKNAEMRAEFQFVPDRSSRFNADDADKLTALSTMDERHLDSDVQTQGGGGRRSAECCNV